MKVSGYVPLYNNADTVLQAVDSLYRQESLLSEVFAVDDSSTDGGAELLQPAGLRVLHQPKNLGRGAARARAMMEARNELVLCCDATNVLAPDFVTRCLPHFEDPKVAAVYGRIVQYKNEGVISRWRGRHLFKMLDVPDHSQSTTDFATYGAMVRRSAAFSVGGYDPKLRHSEDFDLGRRLTRAGWTIIQDPALLVCSVAKNSLAQVLERYWRWNLGITSGVTWSEYLKLCAYAIKVMASKDLKDHDPAAAIISLVCPHYQFWRSRSERRRLLASGQD